MHERFETPGALEVVVENERGLVSVECVATEVTEVHVEGEGRAAELAEATSITCAPEGDGRLLRVAVPRRRFGQCSIGGVRVTITAPIGASLDLRTASANIEVSGRSGGAALHSAGGSIRLAEAEGDLRAATASGTITLGTVSGELRAQSASGGIEVGSATRADLRAVSGDVLLRRLSGEAVVSTVSGRVEAAHCAAGSIRVKSVSGSAELGVPPGVALRVDVDSVSGRVFSEIPIGDGGAPTSGPALTVAVQTVSGDVGLHRAAEPARIA
jgi:DUF4097 and DUF4098 domain-containing protein YvlB